MNKKIFKLGVFLLTISLPFNTLALNKTEMITSVIDSKGNVIKSNAQIELKDLEKGDILDESTLEDIKNKKGLEKFSREAKNITWKSTGKDIYYQGKVIDELPIKIQVNYYLNGKEEELNKMKGKSGRVDINYTFTNSSYDNNSYMYTPFVVIMNTMLNDKNSNIQINHGKVISTGNKNIVNGMATPGLYESLGVEELKDYNSITLSFDTTKFSVPEVYFMATPKLLSEVDINKINQYTSKLSSISLLKNGMNQLENGSKQLVEGTSSLYEGIHTFTEGIHSAYQGSVQITDGLSKLQNGMGSINSLNTLVDTLYQKYQENLKLYNDITSGTTENQLKAGINQATTEKNKLEEQLLQVNSMIQYFSNKEELSEEETIQYNTLLENKKALEEGINKCNNALLEIQNTLSTLSMAPAKIMGANEVISTILMNVLGVNSMDYVNDNTIQVFHQQLGELMSGVDTLQKGSNSLTTGLNQLVEGSKKLDNGSLQLQDGSKELSSGITKINQEGINQLVSISNEINYSSNKIKKLISLSKNYKGFTGTNVDKTIFIYRLSSK